MPPTTVTPAFVRGMVILLVAVMALASSTSCFQRDRKCKKTSSTYGAVRVENNSSSTVYYLYISPTSSSSWGSDWLGSSVILSGGAFTVNNLPVGDYDLKAQTSGGSTVWIQYGVTVSEKTTYVWTLTD